MQDLRASVNLLRRGVVVDPATTWRLTGRRDHVLLQLAVGHRERPDPERLLREADPEAAERPAAAQALRLLHEVQRLAERTQAGGEIRHRLLGETGVRIRREE